MKPAELQCMRVANASAIRRTATDSGPAYVVDEPTGDSEFDAVRIGARTVAACVRAGWLRRIDNVEAELYWITAPGIKALISARAEAVANTRKRCA